MRCKLVTELLPPLHVRGAKGAAAMRAVVAMARETKCRVALTHPSGDAIGADHSVLLLWRPHLSKHGVSSGGLVSAWRRSEAPQPDQRSRLCVLTRGACLRIS